MPRKHIDTALAQTITWVWLGFLVAGAVAWFAYRYWRKQNPPAPPQPERSYSQRLERRLAKGQGGGKRKRRDGPSKGHPHRR